MFESFDSWPDVLAYAERNGRIWYQAPLDLHPVFVLVMRVFKNGKLRLRADSLSFTADSAHLHRMRRRVWEQP